jgi:DNA-binding FadR family transcriptional regulator
MTKISHATERLNSLMNEYQGIDHILQCIVSLNESGKLDELSSTYLEQKSGWSYSKVREVLIILECFGILDIKRGKYTQLTSSLNNFSVSEQDVIKIVKSHILSDEATVSFIGYLADEYHVGEKIEGERFLKDEVHIGREKIREIFLRLECAGFVFREKKKKRVLLRSLDELVSN